MLINQKYSVTYTLLIIICTLGISTFPALFLTKTQAITVDLFTGFILLLVTLLIGYVEFVNNGDIE